MDVKSKVVAGDGGLGGSRQIPRQRDLHEGGSTGKEKRLFVEIRLSEVIRNQSLSDSFKEFVNWSRHACVCHPWWRTKRSWPLVSSTFFFFLLCLLLLTHFGESPVRENLFPPIFWHN